ncbi:lysosomal protective protein precursor, putative [Ixodes scapularis]|uniref:Lysosomal protective protein, putative n=1 Tax=Ixodes scapularis TaxID=6945 RepID=B7QLB8_IXOSC|nr:lysosomal protective protein precursor, putative [Ixodes scapularis]|eukprot:XP_002415973.1 lysosomal protective protein precursor, putative [Ixodes scapularis]
MACNFLGDEWFVNTLGYAIPRTYIDKTRFQIFQGSGHMVPQDKPAHALQMISNFLFGTPF